MRRRAFIAGLGSAAAWPVVARAQHSINAANSCLDGLSGRRSAGTILSYWQCGRNSRVWVG